MSGMRDVHLDEGELLGSLIDETGLSEDSQSHLSVCDSCRSERDRIARELASMGQMARCFSPSPERKLVFPERTVRERPASWVWRRPVAACLAAAAAILFLLAFPLFRTLQVDNASMFSREMLEDEEFMAEVCELEEDALPAAFVDMTSGAQEGDESRNQFSPLPELENVS